ncbi:caspase family protein [Stenotrophomonas sp. PS02289]|uniref:caspase family protein n=1 Tax=Stenotrophomonas sp. PS02289 TaxID=2991422 RepID=UPI00249C3C67|nr:caspase family protein [Stenotrophomonas sp. PS02289]
MSTIQRIGLSDFVRLLAQWQPRRRITEFHLHCTANPRRSEFRGQVTVEAMRRYHMSKGWSDIAQHLTVDPAGGLWTGRDWDRPPASAVGHNGTAQAGPFMIETVGNFDKGLDALDGPQSEAVLAVIVAVLRRFELDETALRFHREFTNAKTCPGSGLDLKEMRADVRALLKGTRHLNLHPVSDAVLGDGDVRSWFAGSDAREIPLASAEEAPSAEVPEDPWMLDEQAALAARLDADPAARAARAPLPADAALRRHTVNLSLGLLSTKGDIDSVLVDPRAVVHKHLVDYLRLRQAQKLPAHLVLYAHGGLVNEASAICYANTVLPWWTENGVFPIFFIWESGFFETLRKTPRGVLGDIGDFFLSRITRPIARSAWSRIKRSAQNASRQALEEHEGRSGGAWILAEYLREVLSEYPLTRVHAVGHSTGPIMLARFLPLLTDYGLVVDTLSYLAPAIRIDTFEAEVVPRLGASNQIRDLCIYTMNDAAEQDDTCAHVYRKSLLYFVREACEDRIGTPILGLQRDLYGNSRMRALFGLPVRDDDRLHARNGDCAVEFSPPEDAPNANPATSAVAHGDFDNDGRTMISVLARILGTAPQITRTSMQFPPPDAFRGCKVDDITRGEADSSQWTNEGEHGCTCCCHGPQQVSANPDGRDGFGDDLDPEEDVAAMSDPVPPTATRGRRIAVCIGIDSYRDQPLQGCVADSQRWADALRREGFSVTHLTNGKATLAALRAALRGLVEGARPDDELVFQYSGHGASVPNTDGTEDDGKDEALVPIDYAQGHLLADDEIYAIVRNLVQGATLTLFMDCCHAGSNSRARIREEAGDDRRPRVMALDKDIVERYRASRRSLTRNAAPAADDEGAAPGVVHFAACQDREYAWESNGEGDFTRAAMSVFAQARQQQWSNQRFIEAVIAALGAPRRQQPQLWKPGVGLAARRLLGA